MALTWQIVDPSVSYAGYAAEATIVWSRVHGLVGLVSHPGLLVPSPSVLRPNGSKLPERAGLDDDCRCKRSFYQIKLMIHRVIRLLR